jgi:hypothetical protein
MGITGGGKSNMLVEWCYSLVEQGYGVCYLDGGGDGVEDVAARIVDNIDSIQPFILRNVHYLQVSTERSFALDPGMLDLEGFEYYAMLQKVVEDTATAIIRPFQEYNFNETPTLRRVLEDILYLCLVTAEDGTRLGLSEALDVLNMGQRDWVEKFLRFLKRMPKEIVGDIQELLQMAMTTRRHEVLSAVNRLRNFLSPLVKTIFSQQAPPFRFQKVMRRDGVILANLKPEGSFTMAHSIAVGGLLMNQVFTIAEHTQREERRPYTLIIDEAEPFLGDDLALALARGRKWKLSIWLGFQNLYFGD